MNKTIDFNPGDLVVYESGPDREEGMVTSTNEEYVFVRYGTNKTSQATRPEDLTKVRA